MSVTSSPAPAATETLLGVAAFSARVLSDTDGMWPPAARAAECRRALALIEAECRSVHAVVTANEEGQST